MRVCALTESQSAKRDFAETRTRMILDSLFVVKISRTESTMLRSNRLCNFI